MKHTRYLFVLAGLLQWFCFNAQVQGKVVEVSPKGDTTVIPGVIVTWHQTNLAATTDGNGNFSIPVSPQTNKLLISATGYKTDTIEVRETGKFILLALKGGVTLSEGGVG